MIDATRVLIADAAERVEHEAKRAIAAVHEGDMLTTQMAVLKRFPASERLWIQLLCAGASLPLSSRRTVIHSKAAKKPRGR